MLSDTGALLGICITNNTQELQEGVSHHSVLLNERMSPNANLLIEETRRDSQSAKPHNRLHYKTYFQVYYVKG